MVLGLSPALGWILFAPFQLAGGLNVRWVTAAGIILMLLPLGYWGAWAPRRGRALALWAATLVLALGVLPAIAGYPPVHWSEWVGGIAGVLSGFALQRFAASLS